MQINFKRLIPNAIIPTRADEGSAGWDLYIPEMVNQFNITSFSPDDAIVLKPGERKLIKLGFATEFILPKKISVEGFMEVFWRVFFDKRVIPNSPDGYQIEIRPRSGWALKKGLTVLNTPGTIDSSYRDEWGVILYNSSEEEIRLYPGDRIAQAVLMPYWKQDWVEVNELSSSERTGGFGSSGQ